MKLLDIYQDYKTRYNEYVILFDTGLFINVYNDDTAVINKLLEYKIKDVGKSYLIGFPTISLNKVLDVLKVNKVNYLVLSKNDNGYYVTDKYKSNKNNYCKYICDYKKIEYLSKRINYISDKLSERIMDNDIESLLSKIEKLL